jgi:hypothetical protein
VQPAAEDLLGAADGVEIAPDGIHVRGVEERDAARVGAVEDGHRGGLVALVPRQSRETGSPVRPRRTCRISASLNCSSST